MRNEYTSALDQILNGIINSTSPKLKCVHQQDDLIEKTRKAVKDEFGIENEEYELLVDKLVEDKLISRHGEPFEHYNVHFRGVNFKKNGGYKGQRRREFWKNVYRVIIPILATIGTVGILLLELQKYHANCLCK